MASGSASRGSRRLKTLVDGTIVARLFDGFITALAFYEPETRETQVLVEWLVQAFYAMDPHVAQQV